MAGCDSECSYRKAGGSIWPAFPRADQWATMRGLAEAADAWPFESIWVFDHFHTVPVPTDEATYEAWSLMSAFAGPGGGTSSRSTQAPPRAA